MHYWPPNYVRCWKKNKEQDNCFEFKQLKILNNGFQHKTGNKKEGPIIKYTFLDQIPEVEVKWQDVPKVMYMWVTW